MSIPYARKTKYQLTADERKYLSGLGNNILLAARTLGVGTETYEALVSPTGGVSLQTIERIRKKIAELIQLRS